MTIFTVIFYGFLMLEIRNYGHVDRKILISWECTSKMKLLAAEANKSNQIVWWSLIMRRSRDKIWGHVITFVVNFTRQQFNGKCKQYSSVTISYYCSLLEYVNIGKIKGYIQIRYFHMICKFKPVVNHGQRRFWSIRIYSWYRFIFWFLHVELFSRNSRFQVI